MTRRFFACVGVARTACRETLFEREHGEAIVRAGTACGDTLSEGGNGEAFFHAEYAEGPGDAENSAPLMETKVTLNLPSFMKLRAG